MSMPPENSVQIKDFAGLMAGANSLNFPMGGAAVQTNLTCLIIGELQVRGGYRVVTFQ